MSIWEKLLKGYVSFVFDDLLSDIDGIAATFDSPDRRCYPCGQQAGGLRDQGQRETVWRLDPLQRHH